jgi:transcriptional regulator with XRE-family HTH domain
MSKKKIADMTMTERAELATQVKPLRLHAKMKQEELAELAGTDRTTIVNIETTKRVPQARVLTRIFDALGVEDGELQFQPETEAWLSSMGTLIEMIPEVTRPKHVNRAIEGLAAGLSDYGDPEYDNVTPFPDVSGTTDYEDGSHQAVASHMEGGAEEDEDQE